jgi:hypothetical protein
VKVFDVWRNCSPHPDEHFLVASCPTLDAALRLLARTTDPENCYIVERGKPIQGPTPGDTTASETN